MATGTSADDAVRAIAAHWGWQDAELSRLTGGLINQTFAVKRGGGPVAVLQRLHPVFGAEVNLDIEAVTAHLAARGMVTPRLWRTPRGEAWVTEAATSPADSPWVWRALTWVEGRCVARAPSAEWAAAGGELVGRFHRAVADLDHRYHFSRGNVHDTPRYFARLAAWLAGEAGAAPGAESDGESLALAREVAAQIAAAAAALAPIPETPQRHCHGDLKLSNLLFREASPIAGLCLVDLDTLCRGTIAFELGDAMRSWCNPAGEDQASVAFDLSLFAAAMRGYRAVADPLLSDDERASIVYGLHTVCVELAARFCIDAFEDRYFGWDAQRYASRRQHNLVRAQSQLSLARSVAAQRDAALDVVRSPC